MSVAVTGLNELIAKLDGAGEAAKPIIRRGLRAGAKIMRDAIAERAPERPALPSKTALPVGALRTDIVIHSGTEDGNIAMIVGPDKLTRHVANWVEYGHREVHGGSSHETKAGSGKYRGNGRASGNVPAHPFIRPAFEASATEAEEAFATTVTKAITRKYGA